MKIKAYHFILVILSRSISPHYLTPISTHLEDFQLKHSQAALKTLIGISIPPSKCHFSVCKAETIHNKRFTDLSYKSKFSLCLHPMLLSMQSMFYGMGVIIIFVIYCILHHCLYSCKSCEFFKSSIS